MKTSTRGIGRNIWVATRAMALLTLLLGVFYTLAITGVGQLIWPAQANGSIITNEAGSPIGSSLIGQSFTDEEGNALSEYFQSRPSAAGDGYDGGASSGSNYGPENEDLITAITARKAEVAKLSAVTEAEVPADAVTASSSGLDPHISSSYAALQIKRVAEVRGLSIDEVRQLVKEHTQGPNLKYLGESTVNVLELNISLDKLEG